MKLPLERELRLADWSFRRRPRLALGLVGTSSSVVAFIAAAMLVVRFVVVLARQ